MENQRSQDRDRSKIDGLMAAIDLLQLSTAGYPEVNSTDIIAFTFSHLGNLYSLSGKTEGGSVGNPTFEVHDAKGLNYYVPWWLIPDSVTAVFRDGESLEISLLCES